MIRAGLIGCGYIAKKHVNTLAKFSEIELIAVSDIKWEKMDEIAVFYDALKGGSTSITFFDHYEDMLIDPRIDIVIISVISSLHAEIARKAIQQNKHVVIEKPFSLSLQDADEIIQLSQKYKKKVLVCHQLRYRPLFQRVKELMEQNYFGELYLGVISLRLNRSANYYKSSSWKGTWEKDGGMLVNQGIHLVDLLIWFMGDIHSVNGEIATKIQNKETEDIAVGLISFENGAKGVVEANTITKPENFGYYLSIFGEKGSLCIGGKDFNTIEHCYVEGYPSLKEELLQISTESNEHYRMYDDFLQYMKQPQQHLMHAQEGKRALELIFALYQSAQKSKTVFLPMEHFSTTDML